MYLYLLAFAKKYLIYTSPHDACANNTPCGFVLSGKSCGVFYQITYIHCGDVYGLFVSRNLLPKSCMIQALLLCIRLWNSGWNADTSFEAYISYTKECKSMETVITVIVIALMAFYDLDFPQYQIPPVPIV